jgi:hypothetical protein
MMLVGAEERSLWTAAVIAKLSKMAAIDKAVASHEAEHAAAYGDAVVIEFRKRDGSRA